MPPDILLIVMLQIKNIKKFIRTLFLSATLLPVLSVITIVWPAPALADASSNLPQSGACNPSTLTYEATYTTSADTYDVYVRMGKRDEAAPATTLYYQSFSDATCQTIGTVTATGSTWTKLGSFKSQQAGLGTFTLASANFKDVPGANSPTVLLVSATHPACQPMTECYVSVGSNKAIVHAAGNTLSDATMHIVTARDPATDTLTRVDYFIDNRFIYTRSTIQPFDRRYVRSGQHTLATVATYKSTQQLVFTSQVDGGYVTEVGYYVFTFWHEQHLIIIFGSVFIVVVVALELLLFALRAIYRRQLWRQERGLSKHNVIGGLSLFNRPHRTRFVSVRSIILVLCFGTAAIVVVTSLNAWAVQLYQVDGHSMESTYFTGNELLVNRLGKTYSAVTHKVYLPRRGQVIVFAKAQDVAFQPETPNAQTYLVKRVIGLPGERVTVENGVIAIYNPVHPNGFNPDSDASWNKTYHLSANDHIDVTLGPDEIFAIGDNRPASVDSRTFGPVKINEIVGNVAIRLTK